MEFFVFIIINTVNILLQVFGGNMDIKTERRHYLNVPMVARYVRIHPVTWKRKIGLRVGVLGCPHQGECGPGFTNVNQRSGCGKFINFSTNLEIRKDWEGKT